MDLAFYNAGCENPHGSHRVAAVVLLRRLIRRLLRPLFLRQVEILQHIIARLDEQPRATALIRQELQVELQLFRDEQADQARAVRALREEIDQAIESFRTELAVLAQRDDQLAERFQAIQAFGWDHVSVTRRLAALEDHIEMVLIQSKADEEGAELDSAQSRMRIA
jgi:hypothetical protein